MTKRLGVGLFAVSLCTLHCSGGSGQDAGAGALTISPATLDFGAVEVGQQSAPVNARVRNGTGSTVGPVAFAVDDAQRWVVSSNTCDGVSLAPGATCVIELRFSPGPVGAAMGTLTVTAGAESASAPLRGTSVAPPGPPKLVMMPTTFDFGEVPQGGVTMRRDFTITNQGGEPSGALSATTTGTAFTIGSDTCSGKPLLVGSSCVVAVSFRPGTALGAVTGTLGVSGTPGGTVMATLSGTGVTAPLLTVTPAEFTFAPITVGTTGASQVFTFVNEGGSATGAMQALLAGADASSFELQANGCSAAIPPNGSCTVTVVPKSTTVGPKVAQLIARTDGAAVVAQLAGRFLSPAKLALYGEGTFGFISGTAERHFLLTNLGEQTSSPISLSVINYQLVSMSQANDCVTGVTTLEGGASCVVRVRITLNSGLGASGSLVASATTGGTTAPIALTATDVPVGPLTGTPALLTFGGVEVGKTAAPLTWTMTNSGTSPVGPFDVSFSSSDFQIESNGCTTALAPTNGTCQVSAKFTPSDAGYRGGSMLVASQDGGARTAVRLDGVGQHLLTIVKTGAGTGRVTGPTRDGGIDCGARCQLLVDHGAIVLSGRTANATAGQDVSYLAEWKLDGGSQCAEAGRDCRVFIGASTTIEASFLRGAQNLAFVSSRPFDSLKGSAAAYDVDCNNFATDAGINDATGRLYRAATTDATQTSLAARLDGGTSWVRLDGRSVADLDAFTAGEVLNSVRFDEYGRETNGALYLTATDGLGAHLPEQSCGNWSMNGASMSSGASWGGAYSWLSAQTNSSCIARLLCLGASRTGALQPVAVPSKKVWLSNLAFTVGAMTPDARCEADKPAGVASGVALVATTSTAAGQKLSATTVYSRPDGTVVGSGATLLAGRQLESGLWQSGDGVYRRPDVGVWTGSSHIGEAGTPESTCGNWGAATGTGRQGRFDSDRLGWWFSREAVPCTASGYLYCVEP